AELDERGERVFLLDQRALPEREVYAALATSGEVARAIRDMVVRGAPAIGVGAAYGMTLAAHAARSTGAADYAEAIRAAGSELRAARPTAVNLGWAVDKALALAERHAAEPGDARHAAMAALARGLHEADVAACRAMGRLGGALLPDAGTVLTHCNA